MIETVGTSSIQSTAVRAQPAASASARAAEPVSKANEFFISSRIRVDNLLDIAILEFLDGGSGEVIRQYPSESQIRGYQRAQELQAEKAAAAADAAPAPEASSSAPAPQEAPQATFVAVSNANTAAPAPAEAPAAPADTARSVLV